jgi:hypothetical protein
MKIYDNVISLEENNSLYKDLVYRRGYYYGEADNPNLPPTGLALNLNPSDDIYLKLYNVLLEKNDAVKNLKLQRSYINLFLPNERPYFHIDGKVTTFLFYINPPVSYDEGGETQFIVNDEVINVLSKPCRLVEFDGMIKHRATSFRTLPRITVAFKFFTTEVWEVQKLLGSSIG